MLRISAVEATVCHCISQRPFFFYSETLFCVYFGEAGRGDDEGIPSNFSLFVFLDKSKTWMGLALFMENINAPFPLFFFSLYVVYFSNKAFIAVLIADPWIIKHSLIIPPLCAFARTDAYLRDNQVCMVCSKTHYDYCCVQLNLRSTVSPSFFIRNKS